MYLFRTLIETGLREVTGLSRKNLSLKGLFDIKFKGSSRSYKWLWMKYSGATIGISPSKSGLLFGIEIELAYSHNLLLRLFLGLMGMNPVFILISLCMSLVFGISSFYYEYSCLSILGKLRCYSVGLLMG